MAFDTKYRPSSYADVLGQEGSVAVLRQYLSEGRGFHQSYVFCGQHGSGKTTLGRILARALLCESPHEGSPCDSCHSCSTLLAGRVHECFEELDAATKSGKADLARILEDVSYSTFSGRRRIYLFDESHRLSKQALDALLKPMEDSLEGSEDKKLICIFCTTEPEKMRATIFSRCAPAFVIRSVSPEGIADRMEHICLQEGVEYERQSLVTIAEVSECHIRDALKTLEGISLLGPVTVRAVGDYLRLGVNDLALLFLGLVGKDLPQLIEVATDMSHEVSPSVAYERLAEGALCAYRAYLGVGKIPSQWDSEKIMELAARGDFLLALSSRFAAPPHKVSRHTLILDAGVAHHSFVGGVDFSAVATLAVGSPVASPSTAVGSPVASPSTAVGSPVESPSISTGMVPPVKGDIVGESKAANNGGVWVDPRGIGNGPTRSTDTSSSLSPQLFRELLLHHLRRQGGSELGSS